MVGAAGREKNYKANCEIGGQAAIQAICDINEAKPGEERRIPGAS
jgi:hypothetical protein